jgi:hypothetical protein
MLTATTGRFQATFLLTAPPHQAQAHPNIQPTIIANRILRII